MQITFTNSLSPPLSAWFGKPRFATEVTASFTDEEYVLLETYDYANRIIYTTYDQAKDPLFLPYLLYPIWPLLKWLHLHIRNETVTVRQLTHGFAITATSLEDLYGRRKEVEAACNELSSHLQILTLDL